MIDVYGLLVYCWHSWDWVGRAIFIGLALMAGYTLFVFVRFARRYYLICRELRVVGAETNPEILRSRRLLVADLGRGLGTVRAIASAAPFLALAGTAYQMALAFMWIAVARSSGLAAVAGGIGSAVVSAGAGILVAIPAVWVHNFIRRRIELLATRLDRALDVSGRRRPDHRAQSLPLRKRFSGLPPFAPIAVTILTGVVPFFLTIPRPYYAKGLRVAVPANCCDYGLCRSDVPNPILVLRVTNNGQVFLNAQREEWEEVPAIVSKIYGSGKPPEIYVQAEDGVPFQTVADAIDIARSSMAEAAARPDVKVYLLTPKLEAGSCALQPVRIPPGRRVRK